MSFHIVESENQYLVVEIFSYNNHFYSKIHNKFKLLDLAENYVKLVSEDGVPVNSVQGGNVSNFDPLLLRKKINKKQLTKYIKTKIGIK
jgi:hypothetical protein